VEAATDVCSMTRSSGHRDRAGLGYGNADDKNRLRAGQVVGIVLGVIAPDAVSLCQMASVTAV
jgi:hypothetical protein